MENTIEVLNYECNYNIYLINSAINKNFKSQNDRRKILMWIKKLQYCSNNVEEMNLRNDFMYFLWTCVKNGELRPPFDDYPPYDQIEKLKHLLRVNVYLHLKLSSKDYLEGGKNINTVQDSFVLDEDPEKFRMGDTLRILIQLLKRNKINGTYTHGSPVGDESKREVNTDWIDDLANADSGMPDLYRRSPDGGAFLSSQPIPKCGTFCYLAVVSKPCEDNEME